MPELNPEVAALIPHRPPFLFVDEIVSTTADSLIARKTWRPEEDFYRGHYPEAPITPGVLLCEAVFQTAALMLGKRRAASSQRGGTPIIAKITEVRFRQPVFPGETVEIEVKQLQALGGFIMLTGLMKKGETRVLSIDFSVAWKEAGEVRPNG